MADLLMTWSNDNLSGHSHQASWHWLNWSFGASCPFSLVHCQGESNAIQTQVAPNDHTAMLETISPNKPAVLLMRSVTVTWSNHRKRPQSGSFLRVIRSWISDSQQLLMFEKVSKTKWTEGSMQYAHIQPGFCEAVLCCFMNRGGKLDYSKQEWKVHHPELKLQEWDLFWPTIFKLVGRSPKTC